MAFWPIITLSYGLVYYQFFPFLSDVTLIKLAGFHYKDFLWQGSKPFLATSQLTRAPTQPTQINFCFVMLNTPINKSHEAILFHFHIKQQVFFLQPLNYNEAQAAGLEPHRGFVPCQKHYTWLSSMLIHLKYIFEINFTGGCDVSDMPSKFSTID